MGQEDKELLLHESAKSTTDASVESLNGQQGAINSNIEETSLTIGMPRGYGSVSCTTTNHEQLIYTWQNMDMFAEVPQVGSTWKRVKNQVRGVFCKERHIPAPRKHIIKNVSGVAYPGELLAVMGSSGAGKTTLLNALAFRSSRNVQVSPAALRMLNGTPVDAREMHARCAYVQQDDLFIGALTVREHLLFQACLRLPRSLSYRQKVQRVDEVIRDLSLGKCKNTLIGTPGRIKGLSGGERKRLAFASEALTDPPLLICDEPTSGLDSFMAYNVVQVLKNLSLQGKTTILTIHQPSSEIFELFDKILLMAQGRVAFLGTKDEAMDFFSYIGAECPTNYNPADFYVQILAVVPGQEDKCRERIGKICDNFAVSKVNRETEENVKKIVARASSLETTQNDVFAYKSSWFAQLRAVLWRSALSVIKEPLLVKVRLIQTIMVAVILGSIFYGQKLDETGVMNINGAIFLFLTNMTFQNVFAVITVFTSEMPVFLREVQSRLYRVDTYFLGKSLAELPLFLLVPFLLTAITYPLIGMRAGLNHFIITLVLVTLTANVATSFGYLISCASSSTSMALSAGPPLIIPLLLFGGYFLNTASVPVYIEWLSYLSWFRYANEGLLINQWGDVKEGEIACGAENITCPKSGKVVLETLNFNVDHFPWDITGLVTLIIAFRIVAYLVLKWRVRQTY